MGDIICEYTAEKGIVSPTFTRDGEVVVASTTSSSIIKLTPGEDEKKNEMEVLASLGGQPEGVAYDSDGLLYVGDQAYCAVLVVREDGSEQHVVKEYEGVSLKVTELMHAAACLLYYSFSRAQVH